MKAVQYFSDTYLEETKKATPSQIADFLEEYIRLHKRSKPSVRRMQLISLRIPAELLSAVRRRASQEQLPYQTWIKKILEDALRRTTDQKLKS